MRAAAPTHLVALVRKHDKAKAAGAARHLVHHHNRVSGVELLEGCRAAVGVGRQVGARDVSLRGALATASDTRGGRRGLLAAALGWLGCPPAHPRAAGRRPAARGCRPRSTAGSKRHSSGSGQQAAAAAAGNGLNGTGAGVAGRSALLRAAKPGGGAGEAERRGTAAVRHQCTPWGLVLAAKRGDHAAEVLSRASALQRAAWASRTLSCAGAASRGLSPPAAGASSTGPADLSRSRSSRSDIAALSWGAPL